MHTTHTNLKNMIFKGFFTHTNTVTKVIFTHTYVTFYTHKRKKTLILVNGNKIPSILTEYIINKMLGTDEQTKSAVDRILEYMDLVMSEEPNYEGLYYDFNKDKTKLYLDTLGFYGEFTKYIGSHYIKDVEVLSRADFNTQLRDSRYFIDYKQSRFKKLTKVKKVFILDVNKLNEKLELRTFNPFGINPFEENEETSSIQINKVINLNINK